VYLHGMIRDDLGRKYSKSLGNALDPMEVIDDVGTDALRFTLMTSSTPGNDTKLSEKALTASRNFMNKLWNIARFVLSNLDETTEEEGRRKKEAGHASRITHHALTLPDHWILSRLDALTADVTRLFEAYQYGEAGRQIRDFLWDEFADWYVEMSKIRLQGDDAQARATAQAVLKTVLEQTLRLLHPFTPFITETIWQRLTEEGGRRKKEEGGNTQHAARSTQPSIMLAPWPTTQGWRDMGAEAEMDLVRELVRAIRNARARNSIIGAWSWNAAIVSADGRQAVFQDQAPIIEFLARVDPTQFEITRHLDTPPAQSVSLVIGEGVQAYLPLAGLLDLDKERERLGKELAEAQAEIERTTALLDKPGFADKAPAHVVQGARDRLAAAQERHARLAARLAEL
jgi:valyl-tRNA synthetase